MFKRITIILTILFSCWFGFRVLASEISGTVTTGVSAGNLKALVSALPRPAGLSGAQVISYTSTPTPSLTITPTGSPIPSPTAQAHFLTSSLSGQVVSLVAVTSIPKAKSSETRTTSLAINPSSSPTSEILNVSYRLDSEAGLQNISSYASIINYFKINWWWLFLIIAVVAEIIHFIPRLFRF